MWRACVIEGWRGFRAHPVPFLLTTLIYGLAARAVGDAGNFALPHFGSAAVSILVGPFLGGVALLSAAARQGEPVDINHAFSPWKRPGDYLVVGLAMSAGALLFLVGAAITCSVFVFAPALAAEGATYRDALGASKDLTVKHWREVLPLALLFLAAVALCVRFTLSLGLLIVVPVGMTAVCALLERLRGLP